MINGIFKISFVFKAIRVFKSQKVPYAIFYHFIPMFLL